MLVRLRVPPDAEPDLALAPTEVSEPKPEHARVAPRATVQPMAAGVVVAEQYRIDGVLGAGAHGVVYRARDLRLERDVALKLCRAPAARSLAHYQRDAMALARLAHPNLVAVHHTGVRDGRLFIAMDLVPGRHARAWADGRTWREIVAVYAAAGAGLAAAHAAGLVHRDLKPENILIGDDGRARVADLGLAHALAQAPDAAAAVGSGEVPLPVDAGDGGDRDGGDGDGERDDDPSPRLPHEDPPNQTPDPRAPAPRPYATPSSRHVAPPSPYAAPEVRAGRDADARADQFALCAALWEAMFEELPAPVTRRLRRDSRGSRAGAKTPQQEQSPSPGSPSGASSGSPSSGSPSPGSASSGSAASARTVEAPREAVQAGREAGMQGSRGAVPTPSATRPARIARGEPVPRALIAVLRRGLADDPEARWPSTEALVAELRRNPHARRWRIALVAAAIAAVVVGAAAGIAALMRPRGGAACSDGAAQLAPVWSPPRAAELAATVGPAAWAALGPALEAHAAAWRAGHAAACRAAAGQAELAERRMFCLARVRAELAGFLDELAEHPRHAPALDALARLTPPAACDALAQLAAETPPPGEPDALARVERTGRVIARAQTALSRGSQARAALLTNDAVALARATGWRVQVAQALAVRAWSLEDAGRTAEARAVLEEAVAIARTEHGDAIAALAMIDLARLVAGEDQGDEARRLLASARTLWERRRDPETRDRLERAEIEVALAGGRIADALAAARARFAAAAAGPPEHAVVHAAELARALVAADAYEEAAAVLERGLATTEARLGAHAQSLQPALVLLVHARLRLGRFPEALDAGRRALAIAERDRDDGARMTAALGAFGEAARIAGDLPGARAAFERALAIERDLGPGRRSDTAKAQHNLAVIEVGAGELARAAEHGAAALAALEAMHGRDRPVLIPALVLVGYVARERGDTAASEAALRRAVELADRFHGRDHYEAGNSRIELASTLVRAGRPREAIALLEPLLTSPAAVPAMAAEARFGLARALAAAGTDRARARALATDARDRYRALGPAAEPQVLEIDAWLAAAR